jgi:hypothetical protein
MNPTATRDGCGIEEEVLPQESTVQGIVLLWRQLYGSNVLYTVPLTPNEDTTGQVMSSDM